MRDIELDCCGFTKEVSRQTVKCDCGNDAVDGSAYCEWCEEIEYLKSVQTRPHDWQEGWITGAVTCRRCRIMATAEDYYTDCER